MPQFEDAQQNLATASAAHAGVQDELFRTRQRLAGVDKRLREQQRVANPNAPEGDATARRLAEEKRRLTALLEQTRTKLGRSREELASARGRFEEWTDPRRHLSVFNDDIPVMLFPLRLETRFKTVSVPGAPSQTQLWVRVFPDECLVDTFDATLTESEVKNAISFWSEYFRAAGVESAERAAWSVLVGSHGSGRATWIIRQFRPLNPLSAEDAEGDATLETKPQSLAAGEVLLVIAARSPLPDAERDALVDFWTATWSADGEVGEEAEAFDALADAVGAARADELRETHRPYNLKEAPPTGFTRETATPRVVFVILPAADNTETKSQSWSKAASATLLPERFVLLGYQGQAEVLNELGQPVQTPLHVSADPRTDAESQFQFDADGNLTLGEELRWMVDFDEAVKRGMGFRVTLTPQQARGFDRLFVLGVRLGADSARGATDLQELFLNHHFGKSGFTLLPQGSPTNNTEESDSAYSRTDDPEASFDFVFKDKARFEETDDWLDKRDGQWLAEALGLETEWLKQIPNAGAVDQSEARAMNTALWPATLGYFMDTMLKPVFDDDAQYYTRWFFNRFVSGRGPVPALRIGRQPYGILPTTAFSRIRWTQGDSKVPHHLVFASKWLEQRPGPFQNWLRQYKSILDALRSRWAQHAQGVAHVDSPVGDPHQTLLDIVGLHPASVEFHQRYANTRDQEHNLAVLWQLFIAWPTLPANELHNEAFQLLASLGYDGEVTPQLFDLFWKVTANPLTGPAIQAGPLSETDPLRVVTTDNRNYIQWLHEWARLNFDTVRVQDGFQAGQWPNALLYILLRHALELGYYDAGIRVLDDAQLLGDEQKARLRTEPHFFHVQQAAASAAAAPGPAANASRYELLYSTYPTVTGDARQSLAEFLPSRIGDLFGTRYLSEQLRALDALSLTPTARLERLMAEHLDCCTYRLDAWMTGLVNFQLASMRYARRGDGEGVEEGAPHRKGIYVGAYGWLENVRPANKTLTPVKLEGELDDIFNKKTPGGVPLPPIVSDASNQGYIHAPSVNHAVTAAVLRNGYVANATPTQPDLLKVNLSSERVRRAMRIIEGIRGGQSLAALLGYEFERGLHDRYQMAECDRFIYPLRLVFPLYTAPETLPEGASIASIEARNVINGLKLLRHVRAAAANRAYPFGFPDTKLPNATGPQSDAIDDEVDRLLDLYDAVADLAVAEGVHQVVMGNYDRAAATLDAYGQATFPPIPDVVQTPRSGIVLTHRVGLQFDAGATSSATDNPRVKAEPAMNLWVSTMLPPPARIGCKVRYLDPAGAEQFAFVTLAQLGLQLLDLVYVLDPDNLQSAAKLVSAGSDADLSSRSELDDRVREFVLRQPALAVRPDLLREISYFEGNTNDFSFVDVASMVRSLRALLLHSRPLRATDIALPTEAKATTESAAAIARTRVDFLPGDLADERDNRLTPLKNDLDAAYPDAGPVVATVVADIDDWFDRMIAACRVLAGYGLPQTGLGALLESRAGLIRRILAKANTVAQRWQRLRDQFDLLMPTVPTLLDDAAKIARLLELERLISTTATDPGGLTVAQLTTAVQVKETAFKARHDSLLSVGQTTETTVAGVLTELTNLLPLTAFEILETTAAEEENQIVVAGADLRARVTQLITGIDARITAIEEKLTAHDAEAAPEKKIQLLTEAAHFVLGDNFVLVPTFRAGTLQGTEWTNAYQSRASLLDFQRDERANPFAVDDWLYTTARVSQKMHAVENLTFLAEALGTAPPLLEPVQFPYAADSPWMALEFPPAAKTLLENELLLYTAHYSKPFNSAEAQCGLLLEEWTEVVPSDTETTGITFQFDKPNAEPPQSILLATPPQFTGAWNWSDLVATLHETLDMARLRAVEPHQLDREAISVFLPATILATTWRPITIAADLSMVNKLASQIK